MSLFGKRKQDEEVDPDPGETHEMPARPYRVLHARLPFYADAECRTDVKGAWLLVLQCEDPKQKQKTVECMPAMKTYSSGQLVRWELNNKNMYEAAWFINPDTGMKEKAWILAAEFVGRIIKV